MRKDVRTPRILQARGRNPSDVDVVGHHEQRQVRHRRPAFTEVELLYARAGWLQGTSDAPDAAYSWPLKSSLTVPPDGVRLSASASTACARA
jgi:hypothetical protein